MQLIGQRFTGRKLEGRQPERHDIGIDAHPAPHVADYSMTIKTNQSQCYNSNDSHVLTF